MTLPAGFQLKATSFFAAAIALALAGGVAEAQQYPLRLPQGTSAQPQRGTSAPERVREEPLQPNPPVGPLYPVAFTYIPAILMSDGTVWANFGYGYVQVRTACREPRVIDGRGMPRTRSERTPCYTRTSQGGLVITR